MEQQQQNQPNKPKRITYVRPQLYIKQRDAFFNEYRYSLIEASTKAGKTTGALCWLVEQAVMEGKPGRNYWWVAPIRTQAEIAYTRLKRYLPQEMYESNEQKLCIRLFNGSLIWFKSADKPDSLYGDDVYGVVVDEASRTKEETWTAVRSTLTFTKGKARLIGNVKNRKNWFYLKCRQAQAGNLPDAIYHAINADDAVSAGVLAAKEIEDARRNLPHDAFMALYFNKPSDDGGNPFGLKAIREVTDDDLSYEEPVVWGWDLAKSVDWTVGIGLDRNGKICRFERFQMPWPTTIVMIKQLTGQLPCLIDSTGVGDPIVETLQKDLWNCEGFKFSAHSKQQLMEGLAVAIQQKLIRISEDVIVSELESFEYEYTSTGVRYSAPEGLHDDCVMALALAVKKFLEPRAIVRAGWD